MLVRVQDDVGLTGVQNRSVVLSAGVFNSGEEGDDEGQQADVDAQQSHLRVQVVPSIMSLSPETRREESVRMSSARLSYTGTVPFLAS